MPVVPFVAELLSAVFDVLAPPSCAGCDAAQQAPGSLLCAACHAELASRVQALVVAEPLAWGVALGPYAGPLGGLIRRGKYRPELAAMDELGALLAAAVDGRLPQADLVVPVPVPARRRARRGFNQAEILAQAVARQQGLPVVAALRRVRATEQASRTTRDRHSGARGSFAATGPCSGRVILVDDVHTTGATAAACADELLAAGASRVGLVCVASAAL